MQVEVKDINGKKVKSIDLPEAIFDVPMNDHVLHNVVKSYRANRRQGTHATKTRAFVSGGGKKPYRQKGTGNARQGSTRSPNHVGGAISHGPLPRDYTQKINRKTKQLAIKIALSDKVRHNKLIVVNDFAISSYSTKHVLGALAALGTPNALVADERKDDFLFKSTRNIHGAVAKAPTELNAEDILRNEAFVVSENGLKALRQRLEGGE